MRIRMFVPLVFSVGFFFFAACSDTSSQNIKPGAFYGTLSVSGDSTNTVTCSATWQVGGGTGTYIELQSGDKTTCSVGTSVITLQEDKSIIDSITYSGTGLPFSPGATYAITLYTNGQTFASTVVLPDSVTITAPSPAQSVAKGSQLQITWNAGDGNSVGFDLFWEIGANSEITAPAVRIAEAI